MDATFLIISLIIFGVILLVLLIYLQIMLRDVKRVKKEDFPKCPDFIFRRYKIWYQSFVLWTFLEYFLMLIPLFTSLATVYFAKGVLFESTDTGNTILLSVMSLLSALLPLVTSHIMPKTHADGFYKGMTCIEHGMLQHNAGLISEEALIEVFKQAEWHTNPLSHS